MCGCSTHQAESAELTLRVEDMTCGHCAGTIKKAVETALPGTRVDADPASKLVSIHGIDNLRTVTTLITEAGHTPSVVA